MALKPLNSVGGFSVGEIPANVILPNADITANNATFSGNVSISNATASWGVLTDNLYYSNGQPWDFQQAAGSNGEIQFNMGDDFDASPNLTFDTANANFKVTGNANITGILSAGSLEVDEIFNGNSNVAIPVANGNVNVSVAGNANVLVVTGTGANVAGYFTSTGNATAANFRAVDGYIESTNPAAGLYLVPASASEGIVGYGKFTPNANVAYDIGEAGAYWANIYANNATLAANLTVTTTANLGNLAIANYVNVNNDLNVTENIYTGNIQANILANVSNLQVANFVNSNLIPATDDQYYLGNTLKRWKDINIAGNANVGVVTATGNISGLNIEFGNLLTGNYANFDNDVVVQGNIANANNISANNYIYSNNATITANLQTGNANLGNLAYANYVNVAFNVDINGSLDATNANFVGNLYIDPSGAANYGIKTDHLYYANGTPWDLQEAAGSNNEIQFNSNDDFAASANFTFDPANNVLKVTGNANVTDTVITPNVNSLTSNLTLTANGFNTVLDNTGNATFPGNVTAHTFYGNVEANITITAANTTVLFSDAGLVDGSTGFTFDKNSNLVSMSGNVNLGEAGENQLINLSNTALEIRGGWGVDNSTAVNIVAGDYPNSSDWGKLSIQGNVSGNSIGYAEANYFIFSNPGYGLGNVVKVDVINNTATNSTSGAIQVTGGIGVSNDSFFGANLSVTGDIANVNNISVTNNVNAVIGNFSGNINALNANLGNLADANFIRTGELLNGNSNIVITANGNILFSVEGLANVHKFSNAGINVVGYVEANGNGTFGALYSNTLTAQGGNLTLYAAAGDNYVELRPTGNGHVNVGNFRIESLATPVAASDAATKQYVDDVAQGLNVHDSAYAATGNTLAILTGGTITYNNGTGGVGANLVLSGSPTANYLSANVFDGNTQAVVGSRILVKSEANAAHNGVYVVDSSTVLTRATDYNSVPEVEAGDFIFVQDGDTYNDSGWVQTSVVATIGTDPILFTQFSGAGTYQAGAGLTLTGTVFSVNVDNVTTEIAGGNVVVKANAQLTTPNIGAATGTSLDLTGNVLAGNLNSNAKVTAANIEVTGNVLANNFNANSNVVANGVTINLALGGNTANFTGNVILPNIAVNLELAGNTANFTGNIVVANFVANGVANVGNLHVNANVVTSLLPNANLTLDLGSSSQRWKDIYTGNVDASGNIDVTGNLSANNFTANTIVADIKANIGPTQIIFGNVTTISTSANQTIATVSTTGVTGVEWLVKGYDSTGAKYSMAIVTAVSDGTNADYSTFGTVNLGGTTGSLAVNMVGSNIELQVTPSSSNSTVWITQFRTI